MGSKTCMAEDQCINKYCGKGYDHTATKFPYYVNYTKWEWPGEDVFDFRVRGVAHPPARAVHTCGRVPVQRVACGV